MIKKQQRKFRLLFTLVLAYFMLASASAQNKVVVIPMAGDDLKPLKNIVSVAKANGDFNNPIAALSSITNASANNPYLVVIAPGVYDLGNEMLTLKPFVSIQGSGAQITTLKSAPNEVGEATVKLVANSSVADLGIESIANLATDTFGILAGGENIVIERCRIKASNFNDRGIGFALLDDSNSVLLDSVEFILEGTTSANGIGRSPSSSIRNSTLRIQDSVFRVLSPFSTAIASTGQSSNTSIEVKDTLIELIADGAVGVSNTSADTQLYSGLTLTSSADNVIAFTGAGSRFRPLLQHSNIILDGANSVGFSTNNGSPRIQNTYIRATTGFTKLGTSSVFNPTYRVDNSVIVGQHTVELDAPGSTINAFFGSSKLDASSSEINAINGTISASCINSYDRNYVALSGACQ